MKPIRSMQALSANPLCTRCFGRCFAKLGHGLSNEERGKVAIGYLKGESIPFEDMDPSRIKEFMEFHEVLPDVLPVEDRTQEPVESGRLPANLDEIVPEDCWLCEGITGEIHDFAKILLKGLEGYEYDNFLVGSKIDEALMAREELLWVDAGVFYPEPIKAELNREIGKILNKEIGKPTEFLNPDIVAKIDTRFNVAEILPSPIFIYGRYRKLQRGLPQTRWYCRSCRGSGCEKCNGTGKMYPTSVEELIAEPAASLTDAEAFFLHGMGREDIDVLMLGNGRPFVLELSRPKKRTLNLDELGNRINEQNTGIIEVMGLRPSTRIEMTAVKMSSSFKSYRCHIIGESTIPNEKLKMVVNTFVERVITQKTPIRVAHRRADKTRNKLVADCKIGSINGLEFTLDIKAESGLYIKELVHGDSGRTQPNLSAELGIKCEVKELDVIEIHDDDWDTENKSSD